MPYASPVENAIALSQAVLHTDKAREMVANYELSSMDVDVELPDYGNLKKPLLEAFTLDSTACAACTYMWGVAQDAKKHFGDRIDVVEYMYNTPENISRIKKMGVKQSIRNTGSSAVSLWETAALIRRHIPTRIF